MQVATLQDPNAIVLPQRAIQDLQGKNYVWIVDAEGKAQQRDVQMGPRIGEDWLVEQGLKARRSRDRRRRAAPEARHAGQGARLLCRHRAPTASRPRRAAGTGT